MNQLLLDIIRFRDERNWKQYHNPKDLAISISLEAAELLEHFQWSDWQEAAQDKRDDIADELADVLIYCFTMADQMGFDLETIIRSKMEKNARKYPIDKAFGKKDKYDTL
ncbi:nucleotide pyrophosphohydrolase [Paenibacillus beijingensis]|uniref:Nucleotide pyrophosphohydrolase n=1 Tax=Paenibacillus beijingensis TaxID=1126833 RepID=A0A0D5NH96_9BACL|nr:nucleotide pyrophosphohydrolase [Paenibacillus beijingensis]AJY74288.1 nucleotide pyrophosphohydrolase [Paenibacillus beijingensis]